jgi:tetratricopeptide (TPR) repeat protein
LRDSLVATDVGVGNIANPRQARIGRSLDSIRTLFRLDRPDDAVRRAQVLLRANPKTGRDGMGAGQLLGLASGLAFEGKHDLARTVLARIDRDVRDTAVLRNQREQRAFITALMDKRFDEVIATIRKRDTLRDGLPRGCDRCTQAELGEAFDMAGMSDSTIAAFERYLATPHGLSMWGIDAGLLAFAHRRLGELYEARGDVPKAAAHYREFVKLWEKADPELQPRVAEVRRRLSRLADVERK